MAIVFDKDGDTVQLVFSLENFGTEQEATVPGGEQVLVQVQGGYPVFVSDTAEEGIEAIPVFPGFPAVIANSAPIYVASPQGQAIVYLTPGSVG